MVYPKSGINFVLYNSSFDVVEENTGYLPVDDRINAIQNLATDQLMMKESGFIEIFVNNDAQTPVYYDNLMVIMRGGNTQEVNVYYPFETIIHLLSDTISSTNAYKYNWKELQKEFNLKWLDYGARMYDPIVGRWWTPDPMAEKYYHISPYAYCGNNPIRFIDPDGLAHYSVDSMGYIQPIIENRQIVGIDDDYDMLFAADGSSIRVNDQSILSNLVYKRSNYKGSYAVTDSQQDAFNVFVFATLNSDVEWGLSGFSEGTSYVVSTSHKSDKIFSATSIEGFDEFDMTFAIHSHQTGETTEASSPPQGVNDMTSLNNMAHRFHDKYGGQWANKLPPHYIYHPNSKSVLQYSIYPYNRGISRGTATTGIGLRRSLGLIK